MMVGLEGGGEEEGMGGGCKLSCARWIMTHLRASRAMLRRSILAIV